MQNPDLEYSIEKLRDGMEDTFREDRILRQAYQFEGEGDYKDISPLQHPEELLDLLVLISKNDPNTVLEVGTGRGGSLYCWCQGTSAYKVVAIDIDFNELLKLDAITTSFEEREGAQDIEFVHTNHRTKLYEHFAKENQNLNFIESNSQDPETRDRVADQFPYGIDFLFIDADHSYEGVMSDFHNYEPLVNDGGIIALHDIKHPRFEVQDFWDEIKEDYQTIEIFNDQKVSTPHLSEAQEENMRAGGGIGVILK